MGSVLAVFSAILTLAALIAVVSFDVPAWLVAPLWVLVMAFLQWALVVQRREWSGRQMASLAAPGAPEDGVTRRRT